MRRLRNIQRELDHVMPRNRVGQELEAVSSVLDDNRELLELVYQDLIGHRQADTKAGEIPSRGIRSFWPAANPV